MTTPEIGTDRYGKSLMNGSSSDDQDNGRGERRRPVLERLTLFCLRRKLWVVGFWVVLTAAGAVASGGLQSRLDQSFSLPGKQGYQVDQTILKTYGGGGGSSPNVVAVRLPAGQRADSPVNRAVITAAFAQIATLGANAVTLPGSHAPSSYRVAYPGTAGAPGSVIDPRLLSADGRTAFGFVYLPEQGFAISSDPSPAMRAVLHNINFPAGTVTAVTGLAALAADSGSHSGGGSGVLLETLLAGFGALLVLAFVFRSFIAVVPLISAAAAILSTFLVISGLAEVVKVSLIVQFLVGLVGLGVAIDYSLLTVTRWREERDQGATNEHAVVTAMATAGHAVVFSGVTVAVGLFALVFLPVPFLRSIGYGGMLIPLISIAVASTLLPVMLGSIGPHLDKHRLGRTSSQVSRPWTWWARLVIRRRWIAAGLAVVVLGLLGYSATQIQVGEPQSRTLSQGGPGLDGLNLLREGSIGSGVISPIEVLLPRGDPQRVIAAADSVPGIRTAFLSGTRPGALVVDVIPDAETSQSPGSDVISPIKRAVQPLGGLVGGTGVESQDFNNAVYGSFPLMLAVIVIISYLLLARAFRSVLLPLKAVLLNLISVGATYGVLVLVWQQGHGSKQIWNIAATGSITNWVPLMVFAFLFGLSMDYEVFILARMREEYDRTGSTPAAVIEGIGRTGRLVTSAALILFLAFLALSQSPGTDIKIFATGLGAGILLDATIVRSLLVPALVSLLGKYNWGLGPRFARVLRVTPSPLKPELPERSQSAGELQPAGAVTD